MLLNGVAAVENKSIVEAYLKSQAEQAELVKQTLITEDAVKEALAWSEDDNDVMEKIVATAKKLEGFKNVKLKEQGSIPTHAITFDVEGTKYYFAINKIAAGQTIRV